jgi:hypothetical protein
MEWTLSLAIPLQVSDESLTFLMTVNPW